MTDKLSSSWVIAFVVSLGGFIFGFDASVISGVIGFVEQEFNLTSWQQGFVVSAPTLGAILANFGAGYFSDRLGRKPVLIIIAILYSISALLSAFAFSYSMLVLARFIGGLAFASLILGPLYIAEISPAAKRGRFVSLNQLNIMIGFSAAYFANYFILKLAQVDVYLLDLVNFKQHIWRWMLGIEAVPAIIYACLLAFVPRSPRWLVLNNRPKEAKQILARMMQPEEAQRQWQEISASQCSEQLPLKLGLSKVFSSKMRMVLTIGLLVGIIQQITGINAVYFYAPTIFEQTGIGKDAAFAQAAMVGVVNLVFTIIAMLLIDRLGRKPLMIIGLIGVTVSMSVCAYGFSQAQYDPRLILGGILGFVASFAISLGPVMWVLLSEIFPNNIRALGIAVVGVINSVVSYIVQLLFPWQLEYLGASVTFAIYAGFALVGLLLVSRILPETRGVSLEQLEQRLTREQAYA
ncbi:sugar porter family MFS transporter [Shewanella sp. WXL01]|uniref:MFS transporter n=1 Tax=Shewanella maritima TaxID=2520507 RepID=A0A411PJ99_9GAMM|nr:MULTISPECIES: sugar porter family MFS transporter [Shewanella]NKF51403.1 sugar porter family MFS transporter [Shewanella sp. WXL01]QBF83656.1 MFS transporter [Shewanella maritima]